MVAPVISFATNARIGQVEPHLTFEETVGVTERSFVEYFVADERGHPSPTREADPDAISDIMRSLYGAQPNQSLLTALAHYHAALDNYFIGGEALVVEHLYMAAEALREPVLAQFSATTGRSEADIMAGEGHEGRKHLLAWSRRELIFAGRSRYICQGEEGE